MKEILGSSLEAGPGAFWKKDKEGLLCGATFSWHSRDWQRRDEGDGISAIQMQLRNCDQMSQGLLSSLPPSAWAGG